MNEKYIFKQRQNAIQSKEAADHKTAVKIEPPKKPVNKDGLKKKLD